MSALKATVIITARQESLTIYPKGENTDALVIEANRQLDLVVGTHFKQVRFPVVAELCITINGGSGNCRSVEARNIRKLIAQAKVVLVEDLLRQTAD